jgi:hypothetical protein
MDPNQALADAREATKVADRTSGPWEHLDALEDALESYRALDEWLSKGGFLPTAWARQPRTPQSNVNRARWQS